MIENYNCYQTEGHRKNSIGTYDFLSKALQQFADLIQSCHKILVLHSKDQIFLQQKLTTEVQQKIKNSLLPQQSLRIKETDQVFNSNVYKRFTCRMIEIILPIKHKATNGGKHMLILARSIKHIENSISSFQQSPNLSLLIQNLLSSFSSFLHNIKNINKCDFLNIGLKEEKSKKSDNSVDTISNTKSISAMASGQQSAKGYRNLITGLNQRFNTMSCLDLDYSYYRSSFFEARKEEDCFNPFIQRNKMIKSSILSYQKQFKNFLAKKARRKEQKRLNFRTSKNKQKKPINSFSFTQKNRQRSIGDSRPPLTAHNKSRRDSKRIAVPTNKVMLGDQRYLSEISYVDISPMKKTKYEMKNILLATNKLKIGPSESNQPISAGKNSIDFSFKKNMRRCFQQVRKAKNSAYMI